MAIAMNSGLIGTGTAVRTGLSMGDDIGYRVSGILDTRDKFEKQRGLWPKA